MSFLGTIEGWFTGVDINAEQQKANTLDAELARINEEAYQRGHIDDSVYQQTRQHIDQQTADSQDYAGQVGTAFGEGIQEGAANIRRGIGATINSIVGTAFRIVPWQLWVIGLVVALIYLWPILRPLLSKLTKRL